MNKLNVGDYVRTKEGYITKIDSCTCWKAKNQWYISYVLPNGCDCASVVTDKFKISPNIIDLIEVGDYVNGKLVVKRNTKEDFAKYLELDNEEIICCADIKSVVTKEMYSQMEYKVGE